MYVELEKQELANQNMIITILLIVLAIGLGANAFLLAKKRKKLGKKKTNKPSGGKKADIPPRETEAGAAAPVEKAPDVENTESVKPGNEGKESA